MQNKVFLGGTCANSTWREELIPMLKIEYFNPIVEDWTEECIAIEEEQKNYKCNIHLYIITSAMEGVYSIAEAVESTFNKYATVYFQVMPEGFTKGQLKSLKATCDLLQRNGTVAFISDELTTISDILNL